MKNEKLKYKNILDDICSDDCNNNDCVLREFLISVHPSPRLLIQLKCVQKFKRHNEKTQGIELTWTTALELWVTSGNAKKFAELYTEDKKYLDLYKEIIQSNNQH